MTNKKKRTTTLTVAKQKAMAVQIRNQFLKSELLKDIAAINDQVNLITISLSPSLSVDDQSLLRNQMLEILRFKYNILDSY